MLADRSMPVISQTQVWSLPSPAQEGRGERKESSSAFLALSIRTRGVLLRIFRAVSSFLVKECLQQAFEQSQVKGNLRIDTYSLVRN